MPRCDPKPRKPMRAVFVNHKHPDTPHVSAVRVTNFAHALAARGHRIILLSETREPSVPPTELAELGSLLSAYNWKTPLSIACRPKSEPVLEWLHQGRCPWGIRQGIIATNYAFRSGVFGHWRKGSRAAIRAIASDFAPDVVWGSMGNTDVWNIARDLAGLTPCAWVADLKDNWDRFVPPGFRALMATRYRDVAAMTALSGAHRRCIRRWFGIDAKIVYSGFPANWLEDFATADKEPASSDIVLAGSLYDGVGMAIFVAGLSDWLESGSAPKNLTVRYFGSDLQKCAMLFESVTQRCAVKIEPYIDPGRLRALQCRAMVNVYPYFAPTLFHHKAIELMTTGRPLIAAPGESEECRELARKVRAPLFSCNSKDEIASALQAILDDRYPRVDTAVLSGYSWDRQAEALESVLINASNRSPHAS